MKPLKGLWEPLITDLQTFFDNTVLPTEPIKLSSGETVINIKTFLETHFISVRKYEGKAFAKPFLDRLVRLKTILEDAKETV